MAKKKNIKRTGLSDVVYGKKSVSKGIQKTNPFEVHVNRQKYAVINRDTKTDRGLPGVSRAKAAKRRQETLGTELNQMHKSNRFKDNRLTGTRFKTGDDLATAKFAKEMISRHESKTSKRKGLFNLNEEEEQDGPPMPQKQMLTHKGQTLKEIEQFQDAVSDGEDDEEADDVLNAEFTDAAHFGGPEESDQRSRKDLIDDLISETKRRKAEAAKEKDQVQNMTEKLDANWKSLIPLIGKLTRTDEVRIKPDAYDRTMREMIFDRRGEPTDKLKSKEELAAKEREKVEKLERERLRRMQDDANEEKPTHRSADDLDDDFYAPAVVDAEEPKIWGQKSEEENDDDDDQDGEIDEEGEEEESEDDDEDNLEDLKSSGDEDDVEDKKPVKKVNAKVKQSKGTIEKTETHEFNFEIPETYEELSAVLHGKKPVEQFAIVDRVIKSNPINLDAANKDKLISFQAYLCQYFNDLFDSDDLTEENLKSAFEVFDKISPLMLPLAEMNPMAAGNMLREVLKEKQGDFEKAKKYPNLEVFIFLKLVERLFSTSDFKHDVVTPALVFISQLLTRCPVESGRDIARGLFLVTIALDYTAQSKRFLPAVIVFLDAVLRLAVPKKTVEVLRIMSLFKNAPSLSPLGGKQKKEAKAGSKTKELQMTANDLIHSGDVDESFKHRVINAATLLAQRFLNQIEDNVASMYYARDLNSIVGDRLNVDSYPEALKENVKALQATLNKLQERNLTPLRAANKPVPMLRMIEPKFEVEQYRDRRRKSGKPTGKSLQEAMRHKVKREMKGALRDIKLDNAFLAKARLDKQRVLDRERKEKVKRIFAEASIQQGELNALDRQNNRKKK